MTNYRTYSKIEHGRAAYPEVAKCVDTVAIMCRIGIFCVHCPNEMCTIICILFLKIKSNILTLIYLYYVIIITNIIITELPTLYLKFVGMVLCRIG